MLAISVLCSGEPLVCRGLEAGTAADAVSSLGGQVLRLDPGLRERRLWFIVSEMRPETARQALAHALACWWTGTALTRDRHLPGAGMAVRSYPPLPDTPPGTEPLLRRLMEPWLSGDGGLAYDPIGLTWTATMSGSGHQHLEQLLAALGDPHPRAPHLVPVPGPPAVRLARAPAGPGLGAWAIDLGRIAGISLALGEDVDADAPAPGGSPATLADAIGLLAARGLQAGYHHGVLCLSNGPAADRRHPAELAAVAVLPTAHLTRDAGRLGMLAVQLGARVLPQLWDQPGWAIAPLPQRDALLVSASPEAIHAVMTALEAADQAGLDAWLR